MSIFQDLYDSEINFKISTFLDNGFEVKLGDEMNGYCAEATFSRFGEIESWLKEKAIENFGDSLFARMYRDGVRACTTAAHTESISPLPAISSH